MTNIASGQKRSWEGVENEENKKPRDRGEGLDWRDVHLKSPSRKPPGRPHGYDRRSPGYYDSAGHRGVETSGRGRRGSDYKRQSDNYDRYGKNDRHKHNYRPSRSPQRRAGSHPRDPRVEEEKEEGE